jgi:DNA-binding CsgD family transcriptional regulator
MVADQAAGDLGLGDSSSLETAGFVGRAGEFALLVAALAAPAALVVLEGEAGIGKTRLVHEYLGSEPGRAHRVLAVQCPPFQQPHTLGPVADALRQIAGDPRSLGLSPLAGALRPLFPEWADSLPAPLEAAGDASMARHRVFCALEELLGRLGASLLVAEDTHWADEATVEFLLFLASRRREGLGLMVTCRPEDVGPGSLLRRLTSRLAAGAGGCRISLGPLDVAATGELMSSMLSGAHVTQEFAAFMHQRTEGVPLAVEESVRVIVSRAEMVRLDGGWVRQSLAAIQVPPTIRDAVLERAGKLGGDARAVLDAVAVLSESAYEANISAVARVSAGQVRAGLRAGLECGLLKERGGSAMGFRHALASQAVYEAIPGPDRRLLHLRAGRALEKVTPVPAARLVRHFKLAGEMASWCRYGELAAAQALASGDEASAAALLHDLVVNASLPATDVARLTKNLPLNALPRPASAQELIGTLRSLLATGALARGEEADVRVQLGQALTNALEWAEGRAELERAVPHLEHDPVARSRAMMLLAWPRGAAYPTEVYIGWLRRAARLPVPADSADRLRLAVDRATALLLLGDEDGWAEAAKIPLDASTAREREQIARSHLNFGDQALRWGRYREAAWRLDRAAGMAMSQERRGVHHEYSGLHKEAMVIRMYLDWRTGSWGDLAGRATALAGEQDLRDLTRLEALLLAGLLDATVGQRDQAEQRMSLVLAEMSQRAEMECTVEAAAGLARLWLADGRAQEAVAATEGPASALTGQGIWVWAADLAPARVAALASVGRVGEAADLVAAFARGLGKCNAPAAQAGLITCQAILAEAEGAHPRAAELFARAAVAWQVLPRPYDALLARERQAGCLIAADRDCEGMALLSDVFRGLSRLGARGDELRVMHTLHKYGVDVKRPWSGGPKGYGEQLSPRELDVARLLVDGRTSREIAKALTLSPRTVDHHLYRAMRKLNVRSRTALAAKVISAGIVSAGPFSNP